MTGMTGELTYPEAGATRGDAPLPAGYRHLHVRTRLGAGAGVMAAVTRALLSWRMHEAMGVRVQASGPLAAAGVTVLTRPGIGPLRIAAPCRVVWAENTPDRAGFGYGTLPGHPLCGEESFVVTFTAEDQVWLDVRAFSRPVHWYVRLGGPATPLLQRAYARRCGATLRRLSRTADDGTARP
jgi:uncharacterized protein (UPF0548 family)